MSFFISLYCIKNKKKVNRAFVFGAFLRYLGRSSVHRILNTAHALTPWCLELHPNTKAQKKPSVSIPPLRQRGVFLLHRELADELAMKIGLRGTGTRELVP